MVAVRISQCRPGLVVRFRALRADFASGTREVFPTFANLRLEFIGMCHVDALVGRALAPLVFT